MIDEIAEKAKANQGKRNDLTSVSLDTEVKNERTNIKLAELAKNNQNGSFKGNRFKKVVLASTDADTTTGRTDQKLTNLKKINH